MSESSIATGAPLWRGWCGTMPIHRHLLNTSPEYVRARAEIETFTYNCRGRRLLRPDTVVEIPVVVHIVWRGETDEVTDAQVRSQLDVLTRDFRACNPDREQVPAPWRSLVADARVEFALATTDPRGEPTTGITRTRTSVASFDADDTVKFAETGGVDAWPTERYLNIWVCQLAGGLLGYAQFPGGPAATDGVVLLHSGFGTEGTASPPFDGGRTATHEVGHWLNLRHIWGDDGNGCNGDDFVPDTPNQGGPNYGTPHWPRLSCDNAPNGDMFMNYMDYTDDVAMFMFTRGQVARMDACLAGPRESFLPAPVPLR